MCNVDGGLMILLEREARIERGLSNVESKLEAAKRNCIEKRGAKRRAGRALQRANNRLNRAKAWQRVLFNAAYPAGARGDPAKYQEWYSYRYGEEYAQCESAMSEAKKAYQKAKRDIYRSDEVVVRLSDKRRKLSSRLDLASQKVLEWIYRRLRADPDDQDVVDVLQHQLGIANYRDVRIVFDPVVPVCNVFYAFGQYPGEHAHIVFTDKGRVRYNRRPGRQHGAQNFANELQPEANPTIAYAGSGDSDPLLMLNCQGCDCLLAQCTVDEL